MAVRRSGSTDDFDKLARAVAMVLRGGAASAGTTGEQPPPNWIDDILKALEPLKSLAPPHGEIPPEDAKRLVQIQAALRRADLSKAERPDKSECHYRTLVIFKG